MGGHAPLECYTDATVSTLLVASTGGHLKQMLRLRPRIPAIDGDVLWVTFPSPQSRSALEGERVLWVRYVGSRDPANVARNSLPALRALRRERFSAAYSTGSAVALSFLPLARAHGIPCHFIESAARGDGPSLTGRMMSRVPGIELYAQYPSWASGRWRYAGSVFDAFEPVEADERAAVRRVVVTLGTMEHGFRRLVERLLAVLPPDAEVLWQTGATDVSGLGIDARAAVPAAELEAAMREADVVVAHAGVGAALSVLEAGRAPLLVPRSGALGEHIDDHQRFIGEDLQRRGLALCRDAGSLDAGDLARSAGMRVRERQDVPPLSLSGVRSP
jgi:UDP-N-acetylglucosamine--N-acetylmuramyl-(pentapeptide) pyrophosphoryl-undecaprenol N-acetylglucosamine transferase